MATQTVITPAAESNPATLSIPTDRPFRLVIDVTPIHGKAYMPSILGERTYEVRTGLESVDLTVTVTEASPAPAMGASHE